MQERQDNAIKRFAVALAFFESHPIAPEPPLLTKWRRELKQSLERIERYADAQRSADQNALSMTSIWRTELRRNRMIPLRKIALPILRYAPGAERALKVPAAHASAGEVARAALDMISWLQKHRRLLSAAGVGPEFMAAFRTEATRLAEATKQRRASVAERSRASRGIAKEIKHGFAALSVMEGLVSLHAPHEMKGWLIVSRPSKKVGRPRKIRRRKRPPLLS